jgi:hypothetical protein
VANAALALFIGTSSRTDVLLDWNIKATEIVIALRMVPDAATRVSAIA